MYRISGVKKRKKNDKSRWMPLKLKSIKYLINLVIFKMFLWGAFCACGGEIQSEFGKRRNSEWNVRCQRKGYQDVIRTTSQPLKYTCIKTSSFLSSAKAARRQSSACHRLRLRFFFTTQHFLKPSLQNPAIASGGECKYPKTHQKLTGSGKRWRMELSVGLSNSL